MSTASNAPSSDTEVNERTQQSSLASRRAKASPEETKQSRLAAAFPLGYKEGFSQWWAALPAAQAENRVLSFVPYLQKPPTQTKTSSAPPSTSPSEAELNAQANKNLSDEPVTTASHSDPYGPRRWQSQMVKLSGKNRALNEFSVERLQEPTENNLVILHGYGAGLGFFYKNFEGLSRPKGWQLYALDLLGMGRSSRPPFRIRAKERSEQIKEAESWFVDALEEWRIQRKLDKFTLLGHSLGGYMAVCYALKYPGHLNKLILASPVGVPEDPYAVKAEMPEPGDSTMANEFTQDQEADIAKTSPGSSNPNLRNAKPEPPRKPLPKWLTYLWDANISPFSFVRWAGPLGPRLVSGWTTRRFSHLPPNEASALHDYSYSLFRLRGSGEYALAYVLAPGAFARSPLIRRIGGVGRQVIGLNSSPGANAPSNDADRTAHPQARENGFPVVLMYGEHDWMDVKGGHAAKERILAEKEKALAEKGTENKERDGGDAKVKIVSKAGHHLYLDNAEEFNEVMRKEMRDVEKRQEHFRD
ncbi:MAG: hypothetical protein Q9227_001044 [Pyrenula ochraceoflavens]